MSCFLIAFGGFERDGSRLVVERDLLNVEDLLNKIPHMYKNVFSAKTVKLLENVFIKFQHLIQFGSLERTLEDLNIDSIISNMKNKLRIYGTTENEIENDITLHFDIIITLYAYFALILFVIIEIRKTI